LSKLKFGGVHGAVEPQAPRRQPGVTDQYNEIKTSGGSIGILLESSSNSIPFVNKAGLRLMRNAGFETHASMGAIQQRYKGYILVF
jgi:hypothetical protein